MGVITELIKKPFSYLGQPKSIKDSVYSNSFKIGNGPNYISEKLKGTVKLDEVKFPSELGVEHPFDFEVNEKLYQCYGLIQAIVDKYVDQIIGPGFYVKSTEKRAEEIINNWLKEVNWDTLFRQWAKESLCKGSAYLEMSGREDEVPTEVKVLNANRMFNRVDKYGRILGYNQIGASKWQAIAKFDKSGFVEFKPHEIAFIAINKIGDCPYGYGIVEPLKSFFNSFNNNKMSMDKIMEKKAEVKYWFKVGLPDKELPTQTTLDNYKNSLEYQKNDHEWVTDAGVDIKTLDFGIPGEKFIYPLEHDLQLILYSAQLPEVIMGKGNVAEGLAKVQIDVLERRVKSFQSEYEKVIEGQIFKRILIANKFGPEVKVEFEWGQPSNDDKMMRIQTLLPLLSNMLLSPGLRNEIEKDIARQLDYDDKVLETIEEEKDRELKEPQPLVPGQNRQEILEEGWVTIKGQRVYIDDEGNMHHGKDASDAYRKDKGNSDRVSEPKNDFKGRITDGERKHFEKKWKESYGDKDDEGLAFDRTSHKYISYNKDKKPLAVLNVDDMDEPGEKVGYVNSALSHGKGEGKRLVENAKQDWDELSMDTTTEDGERLAKGTGFEFMGDTELGKAYVWRKDKNYDKIRKYWSSESRKSYLSKRKGTRVLLKEEPENKKKEFTKHFTQEELKEDYTLKEWINFNYREYVKSILEFINNDDFSDLKANTQLEVDAGYLNSKQVSRLKSVLKNGFISENSILEINKDINEIVKPKDLLVIENNKIKLNEQGNPIISLNKESRAMMITRTEITRTAVNGSLDYYKEKDIKEVQFVASLGQRTCSICEGLNGKMYNLEESYNVIPNQTHPNCRCTFVAISK